MGHFEPQALAQAESYPLPPKQKLVLRQTQHNAFEFSKLFVPENVCISKILPAEAGILTRVHISCAVFLIKELCRVFTVTFFLFSNEICSKYNDHKSLVLVGPEKYEGTSSLKLWLRLEELPLKQKSVLMQKPNIVFEISKLIVPETVYMLRE